MALEYLQRWSATFLPWLNRQILVGSARPEDLVDALNRAVLIDLPAPGALSPRQARQAVVMLSLTGASVSRHFQERHRRYRHTPQLAFEKLAVGLEGVPFLAYFEQVARRTGSGHPDRDSYAALVRWNVPTVRVHWHGEELAVLPGVFDDGQVRTYTGELGERLFLELTKKCEAVERAANDALIPVATGDIELGSPGGIYRIRLATTMLTALRRLMLDFGALPGGEGLTPEHFIDVFRQFAGHWRPGDIPPSGALDPEALARDLLLGLDVPDLHGYVLRVFPALLGAERGRLTRLMELPSLPEQVLSRVGLTREILAKLPPAAFPSLIREHPVVAATYLLSAAHARASGAHLALIEKYLFRPARQRAAAGVPDHRVVSNWHGTTGMDEPWLERLVRARQAHPLSALNAVPRGDLLRLAGLDLPDVVTSDQLDALVSLGGAGGDDPGGDDPGGGGPLAVPSGYHP